METQNLTNEETKQPKIFTKVSEAATEHLIDTVRRTVREFVKQYKPAPEQYRFSLEHRDEAEYMLPSLREDDARLSSYILHLLYAECISSAGVQDPIAEMEAYLRGEEIGDISESVVAYQDWCRLYLTGNIKTEKMQDLFVLCHMIRDQVRRTMTLNAFMRPLDQTKECVG